MQAADHMALALNYLAEARTSPASISPGTDSWQHRQLAEAVKHITQARALDPSARVNGEDRSYSIDDLAYESLRVQSFIDCQNGYNDSDVRRGIAAGETALKYRPNSIDVLMTLAMGYHRILDKPNMHRYLDRVIQLDPKNVDAHNLKNNVTGRMPAQDTSWFAALKEYTVSSPQQFLYVVCIPLFFLVCGYNIYAGFRDANPYQWLLWAFIFCVPGLVKTFWDKVKDS